MFTFIDSAPDATIIVDSQGVILMDNLVAMDGESALEAVEDDTPGLMK